MVRLTALLLVASLLGCKKNGAPTTDMDDFSTGFVDIDLTAEEEELEALMGSEISQAVAPCGDLVRLEPAAIMGRLKDGEIRCLDRTQREAELQTVKRKVSIVLMRDAWAKGDLHRWEGIVRRHLSEIDQSDPALCYMFAKYLSKKGPDYMEEAIRWADIALDNRNVWSGDQFVENVYTLHKIKAISAHKEWRYLSERYTIEPSDELDERVKASRNNTKTLAREWLDYARTAKRSTDAAYQLCISAAGTDGFCDESGAGGGE
ncbi:MAG: hypothetical protein H6734_02545 [Alphaproteobacteria bacterium]|nr:hypothetical protein [Alphaproteobacteria bacterium]